jgi:hypothetical protein
VSCGLWIDLQVRRACRHIGRAGSGEPPHFMNGSDERGELN